MRRGRKRPAVCRGRRGLVTGARDGVRNEIGAGPGKETVMAKRAKKKAGMQVKGATGAVALNEGAALEVKPPVDSGFRTVAVETIVTDGATREGGAEIGALAASIARDGLLQPLIVNPEGKDRYWLLAGRRRLAAVKSLGWKKVAVHIITCDSTERVEALAAVENLERRDLTPVEEGLAVARLLETLGAKREDLERGAAAAISIERAAALLGRSPAWVKDRGILLRLCSKVRALVAKKWLPLGHAKEVAKLWSAVQQYDVAITALGYYPDYRGEIRPEKGGFNLASVERVRHWVAERLATLRGVPWRLDVDFAGRPACATCPENSANCLLFDGKDDKAPEARCLSAVCHAAKMKAAEKALAETVKGAVKEKTVAATVAGVRHRTPAYLKPATVARHLARARGPGPKAKGKKGRKEEVPYDQWPESKHRKAVAAWKEKTWKDVTVALSKKTFGIACALVCTRTTTWYHHIGYEASPSKAIRRKIEPILKCMASGALQNLRTLLADVKLDDVFASTWDGMPKWCIRRLAGFLDVDLLAEPKLEDFLPKEEPEREAKPKKGVCRVCGCTETTPCPGGCAWTDKTETLCTACAAKAKKGPAKGKNPKGKKAKA